MHRTVKMIARSIAHNNNLYMDKVYIFILIKVLVFLQAAKDIGR